MSGETTGDAVPELGALVDQFLEAVNDVQAALPEITPADLAYSLDEAVSGYLEQFSLPLDDYAVLEQHVLHALADDLQGESSDEPVAGGFGDDAAALDAFAVLEAYSSSLSVEDGASAGSDADGAALI